MSHGWLKQQQIKVANIDYRPLDIFPQFLDDFLAGTVHFKFNEVIWTSLVSVSDLPHVLWWHGYFILYTLFYVFGVKRYRVIFQKKYWFPSSGIFLRIKFKPTLLSALVLLKRWSIRHHREPSDDCNSSLWTMDYGASGWWSLARRMFDQSMMIKLFQT